MEECNNWSNLKNTRSPTQCYGALFSKGIFDYMKKEPKAVKPVTMNAHILKSLKMWANY